MEHKLGILFVVFVLFRVVGDDVYEEKCNANNDNDPCNAVYHFIVWKYKVFDD